MDVEFRCPVSGRLFGKATPGGSGEIQVACRDCARSLRDGGGWHGRVVHVFGMDGQLLRSLELESHPVHRATAP